MKKSILVTILVTSIILVLAGTSVGVWYALTPNDDSGIAIVSATADSENDTVSVVLSCEGEEQTGQNYRHQNNYAYMHQIQIKNGTTEVILYQEQYQWQYRHRIQNGQNYSYQYQVEGLEQGQMLQIRIEYNNGKVVTHNFMVNH